MTSSPTAGSTESGPSSFGALVPGSFDRAVIALTSRLPDNWLGLRLAIVLRRLVTMRLAYPDGALDVVRWGVRLRLHPRDNGCEKNLLFTPQMYEPAERAELAAEIDRARRAHIHRFCRLGGQGRQGCTGRRSTRPRRHPCSQIRRERCSHRRCSNLVAALAAWRNRSDPRHQDRCRGRRGRGPGAVFPRRLEIDVAPPHSIGGRALRLDDRPVLVARVAGLYRSFTHSAECDVAPRGLIDPAR